MFYIVNKSQRYHYIKTFIIHTHNIIFFFFISTWKLDKVFWHFSFVFRIKHIKNCEKKWRIKLTLEYFFRKIFHSPHYDGFLLENFSSFLWQINKRKKIDLKSRPIFNKVETQWINLPNQKKKLLNYRIYRWLLINLI